MMTDDRTPEQIALDDQIREEVEATGGAIAQMTPEQRAEVRARVLERRRALQAARVRNDDG